MDNFDEIFANGMAQLGARGRNRVARAKAAQKGEQPQLSPEQVRKAATARLTAKKPQATTTGELSAWAALHGLTPEQGALAWERAKAEGKWDTIAAGVTAANLTPSEVAPQERTASQQRASRRATIRRIGLVRLTLAEMNQRVSRLVKAHYSEQNAVLSDLTKKLQQEGFTERDSKRMAEAIEAEFRALLKTEGLRMLDKAFLRDDLNIQNTKEHRVAMKLLEHLEAGVLTDEKYFQAFAETYGLKEVTPEMAAELNALQQKAAKATEGRFERQAKQNILDYINKSIGSTKGKWWAVWYGNILSAFSTQERNFVDTGWNVLGNFTAELVRPNNWWKTPLAFTGFIKGLKAAKAAAVTTMKTGERPIEIREKFLHQKSILETNPFTGALKPLNMLKYVTRTLMAVDTVWAVSATEGKAYMLAADIAKQGGKRLTHNQIVDQVNQLLNRTKEREAAYAKQVKAEGLTGRDATLRVYELMTHERETHEVEYFDRKGNRRTEMVDLENNPHSWGTIVTYNYPAEGWLGSLSRGIEQLDLPPLVVKPIIPFTNIIANVLNAKLDWTPWAFVRAQFGITDQQGKRRQYKGTEKEALYAKGIMGSTAMISLMIMGMMKLDADEEDDPEKKKQTAYFPTIHGGGPKERRKGYQLRQSGWRPHSIRFGDTYYDYMLTPLAIPLSIVGNALDFYRYDKPKASAEDENLMMQATTYALMRNIDTVTSLSFLSSVIPLFGAIESAHENPEQGARTIQRTLARSISTIYTPNLAKQISKIYDPTIREAYSDNPAAQFAEYLMRETPIASHQLKPKINALGEPAKFDLAVTFGRHKPDRVWELIAKRAAFVPRISRSTLFDNGDEMNDGQFYDYAKLAGQLTRKKIENSISWLERMDDERLKKRISKYAREARKTAKWQVYAKSRGW